MSNALIKEGNIMIPEGSSEAMVDRLVMCQGDWQETTTRKGKLRICRDMFITDYKGSCQLGVVKNGNLSIRRNITVDEKKQMVEHYGLEPRQTGPFVHAKTYRTPQSNSIVDWLLGGCGG